MGVRKVRQAADDFDTISSSLTGTGQVVEYRETGRAPWGGGVERKLRILIHVDSYVAQCRVEVEVWDPGACRWNEVHHLDGEELKVDRKIGYRPQRPTKADFAADRAELLRVAKEVLS